MRTTKSSTRAFDVKSSSATLSPRDVILIFVGVVLGSIVSIPLYSSANNFPVLVSPYSQPSLLPSGKPINSYNARIITKCPLSANYSIGQTQLVCSRNCVQNYTNWAPTSITSENPSGVAKLRHHGAAHWAAKYPVAIDILDVGANSGGIAAAILSQGKGHRVLSVEPVQKNLNQLCKVAQLNSWLNSPHLTIVHAAASDRVANETIYIPIGREDNAALSTDAATQNVKNTKRAEEIFLLDGDGLLEETGFRPKFIKIDTQGHELFVLKGLKRYLKNAGNGEVIVMAELDSGLTKASGVDIMDIYKVMVEELGYSISCKPNCKFDENGVVSQFTGELLKKSEFPPEGNCGDAFYVKL